MEQIQTPYDKYWSKYKDQNGKILPQFDYFTIKRKLIKFAERLPQCDFKEQGKNEILCECGQIINKKNDFLAEITDYCCTLFYLCPKCKKVAVIID